MSSMYGETIKLSIFGQSHGPAIGMVLDGVPAGLPVDLVKLQSFLDRRAPGRNSISSARLEMDVPEFLSGIVNGYTCGAPIAAVIRNQNARSGDYVQWKDCPRPGHADLTAQLKYHGYQDAAGGGHFSGRLTAPLCIAGGLCIQWLESKNIHIGAHLASVGDVFDDSFDAMKPQLNEICGDLPVINLAAKQRMIELIQSVKRQNNSIGGTVECAVTGLPAGLGEPMFGGMESRIAQLIYGIPAVKGLDFGAGFHAAQMLGSQHNDAYTAENGSVHTLSNYAGGILGGITTGMPLIFRVAIKPTPSIGKPQDSVNINTMENTTISITGRHDPCIAPRAVPVIEAAAAIAVYDATLSNHDF